MLMQGGEYPMTVVLETAGLMKSFGGVLVIDDLSMQLDEGEALGIVGPNGAGKTTLFNLITGVYRPDAGKVTFDGKDITGLPRQNAAAQGIGRTFQIPKPFSDMSVFENVLVCAAYGRNMTERASYERCVETLEITRLSDEGEPCSRVRCRCSTASGSSWPARSPATPRSCSWTRSPAGSPRARWRSSSRPSRTSHREGSPSCGSSTSCTPCSRSCDRIIAISFGRNLIEGEPQRGHVQRRGAGLLHGGDAAMSLPRAQGRRRLLRRLPGPLQGLVQGRRRQTFAFIGANGGGKSTLLARSPACSARPRGHVLFHGEPVDQYARLQARGDGHRARPRGAPGVPEPHSAREPGHRRLRRPQGRLEHRLRLRAVPAAQAAPQAAGRRVSPVASSRPWPSAGRSWPTPSSS